MGVRGLLVASICLFLPAASARGQHRTLTVDAAHSQVRFTLSDPLHTVNGTFKVTQGSIVFDAADDDMQGIITVDAASGVSGNGTRDKKMTSDEMQAGRFSSVTFAPRRFTGTLNPAGDSNISVEGIFTLLGKSHAITVPMHVHLSHSTWRAAGTFLIPYVQWGMKDPSVFLLHVSKEVAVGLELVGTAAE